MTVTTYAGLQAALGTWLTRTDTDTYAPDWIALAEARIGRELRVDQMLTRATATLASEFMAVPTDFLAPKSMRLTANTKILLQFLSVEQLTIAQQTTGTPPVLGYARIGDQFWFYPAPTSDDVELIYYAAIPALSDSNTTNWLLTASPDVYVRGAMLEAALFYEDDTLTQTYSALFSDAVQAVVAAARRDAQAANINVSPSGQPI